MDGLRNGLRRLIAGTHRSGSARRGTDVVSPRNVVVSINDERPGSVNAVSASQETVIHQRRGQPPESTTHQEKTHGRSDTDPDR